MGTMRYLSARCCGLLLAALGSTAPVMASEPAWYWHYTPLDGLTHGIGVSRPDGTRAGSWQARLNFGYDLDSLGGSLQRQQTLLDQYPQWYLATGIRFLRALDEDERVCGGFACSGPASLWDATVYSRWTWGFTADNFRLDLGYGAQLSVSERRASDRLLWSLNPTLDVLLGWRL